MGWLSRVFYGVDLDEEQERSDDLDRKLAVENKRDLDAGVLTPEMYDQYEESRRANYISDVSGEVRNSFNTELNSRAASVRDFTGDVVGTALLTPLKLIPWQVWLIAVGVVVWKLGLLDGIFSKLRR